MALNGRKTLAKNSFCFLLHWYLIFQPSIGRAALTIPSDIQTFFSVLPQLLLSQILTFNQNNAFPILVAFFVMPIVLFIKIKRKEKISSLIFVLAIPIIFLLIKSILAVIVDTDINI